MNFGSIFLFASFFAKTRCSYFRVNDVTSEVLLLTFLRVLLCCGHLFVSNFQSHNITIVKYGMKPTLRTTNTGTELLCDLCMTCVWHVYDLCTELLWTKHLLIYDSESANNRRVSVAAMSARAVVQGLTHRWRWGGELRARPTSRSTVTEMGNRGCWLDRVCSAQCINKQQQPAV